MTMTIHQANQGSGGGPELEAALDSVSHQVGHRGHVNIVQCDDNVTCYQSTCNVVMFDMWPGGGAEAAAAEGGGGPRQRHLHRHGGAPGPAHQVTIQGVYTTLLRHPVSVL